MCHTHAQSCPQDKSVIVCNLGSRIQDHARVTRPTIDSVVDGYILGTAVDTLRVKSTSGSVVAHPGVSTVLLNKATDRSFVNQPSVGLSELS